MTNGRALCVLRHGLLAVALLLGRSALIAHDAIHWQPKLDGKVCELCLHHVGQSEIDARVASFIVEQVPPPHDLPRHFRSVCVAPPRRCPIRGPPPHFV